MSDLIPRHVAEKRPVQVRTTPRSITLTNVRPAPVGQQQALADLESMTDSRYALPARFKAMEKRGEVQEIGERRLNKNTGQLTIFYRRLKPPTPGYVKYLKRGAYAAGAFAALYLGLMLVVDAVTPLLPYLAGAAVVVGLLCVIGGRIAAGRAHGHCPGAFHR